MGSLLRAMVAGSMLAALISAGCGGSKSPCSEGLEPVVEFASPTGNVLTEFNDADGDIDNGVQYDVQLRTIDVPAGTTLSLSDGSGSPVEAEVVYSDAESRTGIAQFGQWTFTEGTQDLCATGTAVIGWDEEGGTGCKPRSVPIEICKTVTVQLDVPACRFEAPSDGSTLTAGDDVSAERGFQADVALVCKGVDDGELVELQIDQRPPISNELANAAVGFAAVDLVEGTNLLLATTTGWDGSNVSAQIGVTVDTGGCAVRLLPADGSTFSAEDDEDDFTEGLQVTLTVATDAAGVFACADGSDVTLHLGGEELAAGQLADGQLQFSATLPEGQVEAWAEVSGERDGSSLVNSYRVCTTPVTVAIQAPADGLTITDAADRDPDTAGIQLAVSGSSTGVPDAASLQVLVDGEVFPSAANPLQPAVFFPGSNYSFEYITLTSGQRRVQVVGSDACGAQASVEHQLEVQSEQPICTITDPVDGQVLLAADDADGDPANDLQYDVQVTTDNVDDGQAISLLIGGQGPVAGTVQAGAWTPEVSFLDGNNKFLRCQIAGEPASAPIYVTVDGHPPGIEIVSPLDGAELDTTDATVEVVTSGVADGQTFEVTWTDGDQQDSRTGTVVDGAGGLEISLFGGAGTVNNVISASVQDAAGNPGSDEIQVDVSLPSDPPAIVFVDPDGTAQQPIPIDEGDRIYTVIVQIERVVAGAAATLELFDNGLPRQQETADVSGAGFATFGDVLLPRGEVELRVSASNAVGTGSESLLLEVGDTTLPRVILVAPADGTYTADGALSVSIDSDVAEGQPCTVCRRDTPAAPSLPPICLLANAIAQGTTDAAGDVALELPAPLDEGDHELWASCEAADNRTGTSAPNRVVVDQTPPEVAFVEPLEGAIYNADSPDRSPATPGFQIRVLLSADVEDGVVADQLFVDGSPAAIAGDPPTFEAGQATYNAVTAATGASHTLEATVCDKANNCADATPVTILVDRQAPDVVIADPADGFELGAGDDNSAAAGFQHDVVCNFTGASEGDVLALRRNVENEGWENIATHQLAANETNSYTFDRATFDPTPDRYATVQLEVTITDQAENTAQAFSGGTLAPQAPDVNITRPTDGQQFRLTNDMCPEPGFQTQVDIATANTGQGDRLVLCICNGAQCPEADPQSADICMRYGNGNTLFEGTVTGTTTYLTCMPFSEGTNILTAFSENVPGQGNFSVPVTVSVDSIPPSVDTLVVGADADSDGCVNAAEGELVVTAEISDQGSGVEGRTARLMAEWPPGTAIASSTVSGGQAVFNTTPADGDYDLTVVITDAFGNPNIKQSNPTIDDPEAQFTIRFDHTAPTIAITDPDHPNLLYDDDLDPGTEDVDFDFCATVTGAEDGQMVHFLPAAQSEALVGGVACLLTSLGQGPALLEAEVTDACGNEATPASMAVFVDTIRPTISCSQPSGGDTFQDPAVDFICSTSGTDATQRITVRSGGQQRCQADVLIPGPTTFVCNLPAGTHDLRVTTRDPAGNVSEEFQINPVTIEVDGCDITLQDLDNPAVLNASHDSDGNPDNGLQLDVTACSVTCDSSSCGACEVVLDLDGTPVGPAQGLGADGCVTFQDVPLADGETGTVITATIDDQQGNINTSSITVELVDLYAPTLTRLTPGADDVVCVAASGNPDANGTTILADKVAGEPCEMDFSFEVTDGGDPIYPGQLSLELNGNPIGGPTSITSSSQTVSYSNRQLDHGTTSNLVIVVTDYAGNETSIPLSVQADVVAPAEVADASATLQHTRHADVDIAWTAVGDDEVDGSPQAYFVRWARSAITDDLSWQNAEEVYYGASAGVSVVLPPLNTYHLAVRAVDDLGNMSPIPASDVSVDNLWNHAEHLRDPDWFTGYRLCNAGDIDGDGIEDLAAASPLYDTNVGEALVFQGVGDLSSWSDVGFPVVLRDGTQGELFAIFLRGIGDIDGDGYDDLMISGDGFDGSRGRVQIYFGREDFFSSPPQSSDLEIRGPIGTSGQFGYSFANIGNVNGDSYEDVFVSANLLDGSGRGYIFLGRSRADWTDPSFVSGDDGDGSAFVPAANADVTFLGSNIDDRFGYRHGHTRLGDLDGDGYGDFAVGASAVNEVYTFDGNEVRQITGRDVDPASDSVDVLVEEATYDNEGFGNNAVGGIDITGDGINDLLVSSAHHKRLYLYMGIDEGAGDPSVKIEPNAVQVFGMPVNLFADNLDVKDVNLDGIPDVFVSTNTSSNPRAFLYFNNGDPGALEPFFDQPGSTLSGSDGSYFGIDVAIGDFNGDLLPDIVLGEPGTGKIHVYY